MAPINILSLSGTNHMTHARKIMAFFYARQSIWLLLQWISASGSFHPVIQPHKTWPWRCFGIRLCYIYSMSSVYAKISYLVIPSFLHLRTCLTRTIDIWCHVLDSNWLYMVYTQKSKTLCSASSSSSYQYVHEYINDNDWPWVRLVAHKFIVSSAQVGGFFGL